MIHSDAFSKLSRERGLKYIAPTVQYALYSSMRDVVLQFGRNNNLRELPLWLPSLFFVVHLLYQRIPIHVGHNHIQFSLWNRLRHRIR